MEFSRFRIETGPVDYSSPSVLEPLDFLLWADDFLRGFSKMRSSTSGHCFLISLAILDIVTLNEYLGYIMAYFASLSYELFSSVQP